MKSGFNPVAAHHEAGHAVIAHKLGVTVRSVSIAADGGGVTKLRVGAGERAILIALAGPYAQRRYAPQSRWRSGNHLGFLPRADARDFDIVIKLIDRMELGTDKVADAYRRYVEARAEHLVEQHWRQIEHTAAELLQHGTMTGEAMAAAWWKH